MISGLLTHLAATANACTPTGGSFLGLPTWYHFLPGVIDANGHCTPTLNSLSDIWLVVAAITEILLRIAALVAIIMVVVGGVQFITSQGDPNQTKQARGTIINALIGLLLAIAAATIVTFIAGKFNS